MDVFGINSFGISSDASTQVLIGGALISDKGTISKDLSSINFSPAGISFIFGYMIEAFGGTPLTTNSLAYYGQISVIEASSQSFNYGEPSVSFNSFGSVSISGSKIIVSRTVSNSAYGGFHLSFVIYGHY